MRRDRGDTTLRAIGLAVALFAITVNFLQPLVHAALMRDGAPSALWTVFCSGTQQETGKDPAPATAADHECCLGLAHAATPAAPSPDFTAVEPGVSAGHRLQPADRLPAVGIRDGPHRPRGPPALA